VGIINDATVGYTEGGLGPAAARNVGIARARAPWLLFLDADDALLPRALEHLLRGALAYPEASYLYGGVWRLNGDGHQAYGAPQRYDRVRLLQGALHLVTGLYETEAIRAVGGFDPDWPAHEDYELALKLAVAGRCGQAIAAGTFVYRTASGQERTKNQQKNDALRVALKGRYGAYFEGGKPMAGCCGGSKAARYAAAQALEPLGGAMGADALAPDARVRMEAVDARPGYYKNPFGGSGESYRSTAASPYISANPVDVEWLRAQGFRVLARPTGADRVPGLAPILQPSADLALLPSEREGVIMAPPPIDEDLPDVTAPDAPSIPRRAKRPA
jgi:hypothetical protein